GPGRTRWPRCCSAAASSGRTSAPSSGTRRTRRRTPSWWLEWWQPSGRGSRRVMTDRLVRGWALPTRRVHPADAAGEILVTRPGWQLGRQSPSVLIRQLQPDRVPSMDANGGKLLLPNSEDRTGQPRSHGHAARPRNVNQADDPRVDGRFWVVLGCQRYLRRRRKDRTSWWRPRR